MSKYIELKAQAKELMRQANEILELEKNEAIANIKTLIDQYGIDAKDLGLAVTRQRANKNAKTNRPAKYRDSEGNEWTGRGRMPIWLAKKVEAGEDREDYLIAV